MNPQGLVREGPIGGQRMDGFNKKVSQTLIKGEVKGPIGGQRMEGVGLTVRQRL